MADQMAALELPKCAPPSGCLGTCLPFIDCAAAFAHIEKPGSGEQGSSEHLPLDGEATLHEEVKVSAAAAGCDDKTCTDCANAVDAALDAADPNETLSDVAGDCSAAASAAALADGATQEQADQIGSVAGEMAAGNWRSRHAGEVWQ